MINGYKTIAETAEEWGISARRVQILCSEGRIDGAAKLGRTWAIPSDAKKPRDERIISGQYKGWRKEHSCALKNTEYEHTKKIINK